MRRAGGDGPPTLLLHGFGSDALSWLGTIPALLSISTVYDLDLPGHGDAGPDVGDASPTALMERVATAIDAQRVRKLHVVGHSLGGGIGLLLAQRRPDLVASLVLIAPAGVGAAIDHGFLEGYSQLRDVGAATEMLRALVTRPHLIGRPVVKRALDQLERPGARDTLARVAAGLVFGEPALRAAAADVAASGLARMIVWGRDDRINPLEPARLAQFGGEQHVLDDTGHLPHIERPKATNDVLARFLRLNVIA